VLAADLIDGVETAFVDHAHRHDDLVHLELGQQRRERPRRAQHLDAVDDLADLVRIVVDEGDGQEPQRVVVAQLAEEHFAAVARAVDHDALLLALVPGALGDEVTDQAEGNAAARDAE
jgi:hypothetical protein